MRRFALFLFLAVMAGLGIWFGLRSKGARAAGAEITALLPADTVAFVHLPDLSRTRAEWHESDLYKLWREPAVQEFLQKPLRASASAAKAEETVAQLEQLGMKDAFVAVIAWEGNQLKIAGGFRFKGSARDAEKIIGKWRPDAPPPSAETTRQVLSYRGRQIDVVMQNGATIATAYDGTWFFAANDVEELKALLDRAARATSNSPTLQGEPNFTAASRHLPRKYALSAYARVDPYIARLTKSLPPESPDAARLAPLRQVHSISAATTFENGKLRDVLFVAMPQQAGTPALTRSSLALGTRDTFLYIASVLALSNAGAVQNAGTSGISLPAALQSVWAASAGNGLTGVDVEAAFDPEISLLGEWAENARMPGLIASLPVKDRAKADAVISALRSANPEAAWTASERDGVQYFTSAPVTPLLAIAPTIALADQLLVFGIDPAAVESAMARGRSGGKELANWETFLKAEALVPVPTQSFAFIDTALLYTRLDAAVRPMLIMAAAFMPAASKTVDWSKLPPADVVARHLSPFSMSQTYESDGYATSAIGPFSVYGVIVGAAAASHHAATWYRQLSGGAPLEDADAAATPAEEEPPGETP